MKLMITGFLIFSATLVFSQNIRLYQSDSLYKANKVRIMRWSVDYTNAPGLRIYFDKEGRVTRYERDPFFNGLQLTTYCTYDAKGLLIGQVDTLRGVKRDKQTIKKIEKQGGDPASYFPMVKRNSYEVARYQIEYDSGRVASVTRYNPNGEIDYKDVFRNGNTERERIHYEKGTSVSVSVLKYERDRFPEKYSGWEETSSGRREWEYRFRYVLEKGRIVLYTRFDYESEAETGSFHYNDRGLLTEKGGYQIEKFEYEYYK